NTTEYHVHIAPFRRVGGNVVIMLESRWILGLVKQAGGRAPLGFHVICVNHRNCARKHSYRERTRPKSSHPASPFLFRICWMKSYGFLRRKKGMPARNLMRTRKKPGGPGFDRVSALLA